MNSVFLVIGVVGAMATSFVSYFLLSIISKWRSTLWLKRHGVEAEARILKAEVINEEGRYLPFVRLKVEVATCESESFITSFDSLFSFSQLSELVAGNMVRLKYNPADTTQVSLVKQRPLSNKNEQWASVAKTPQLSLAS